MHNIVLMRASVSKDDQMHIGKDHRASVSKEDQMHSIVVIRIRGPVFLRTIKCIVLS